MEKFKYPFVIYPAAEAGYVAEIPALKGCLVQGETLSETLETAQQTGLKLPKVETEIERVKQKLAA